MEWMKEDYFIVTDLYKYRPNLWGCKLLEAGQLGLMGRELAHQTSKPVSNPSWDATVHSVCETFNVMHVV